MARLTITSLEAATHISAYAPPCAIPYLVDSVAQDEALFDAAPWQVAQKRHLRASFRGTQEASP